MPENFFYFDYNATTPMALPVFQAMELFLKEYYGNPSSLHQGAREPRRALREARRQLAGLLGTPDENTLIFTSGGTESNNAALRSALATSRKRRVITSQIEHSSVLRVVLQLEKEGYEVIRLAVGRQGQLDLDELREALTENTAVVSLMMANNETGVLFPVEEAGEIIKARGVLFHVDAVQAVGKFPINLKNSSIDYLSLSGHKFYGPKGIGALYIKPGVAYQSHVIGGSQEHGRRGGTENVPGAAGLGKACELVRQDLQEEIARLGQLRDRFESRILAENTGAEIAGQKAVRLPNTSLMLFQGLDSEAFLYALDGEGLACSSGSACMSGASEPSHVLTAMGYPNDKALSAIRFSFGRFTRAEEIEQAVAIVGRTLARLRALGTQAASGS